MSEIGKWSGMRSALEGKRRGRGGKSGCRSKNIMEMMRKNLV